MLERVSNRKVTNSSNGLNHVAVYHDYKGDLWQLKESACNDYEEHWIFIIAGNILNHLPLPQYTISFVDCIAVKSYLQKLKLLWDMMPCRRVISSWFLEKPVSTNMSEKKNPAKRP